MDAATVREKVRVARALGKLPAIAWGAAELCSARTIAGGFGNPSRVPI